MLQPVPVPDGKVRFDPCWLGADEAQALFEALRAEVGWENHAVRLFGREHPAPRLSCWMGDPGTAYRYSGVVREPHPWPPALAAVHARLRSRLGLDFDSALANLYRDGRDAMGWHSDDEPELGPSPVIASLSLGATRRFVLRHRASGNRFVFELPSGSLLVMEGATQANYRHALPRTTRPVGARINLTFRRLLAWRGAPGA